MNNMEIAGRQKEIALLQSLYDNRESSFLAVYGRRRIGKTYLIRQVYENDIVFDCSGVLEENMSFQLEIFWTAINERQPEKLPVPPPKTWLQAFFQLKMYLNTLNNDKKKVIFLDEIPWFETPRSGFLSALDNFWNMYCTKRTDIILVICGSAASWIIDKVVNSRGGLHNRLTKRLLLKPFTLRETQAFFDMNNAQLSLKDIAEIYMCVGGIPFYLKDIKTGYSVPQMLDQLFFGEQAALKDEFQNLYASLFKNNVFHEKVVTALASKNKGLTRNEIIQTLGIQSGGDLTIVLEELTQCGFIMPIYPINKTKEDCLYRLIDEYSLFYFKFLKDGKTKSSWMQITESPVYKIWSGYAFENLCFKHIEQIKKAFGINGIITNEYSYIFKGNKDEKGTQIDMIIDRADNCMNLLEVKFYDDEFEVTDSYAQQLRQKTSIFKRKTNTKKNIFITMLTVYGAKKNEHYLSIVTNQLLIDDLFT
jgi:uncharacterized protein